MLSYLELVELPDGDIVLKRPGEDSEPLVTIRFSTESRDYINGSLLEVARAMVQAGIEASAGSIESSLSDLDFEEAVTEDLFTDTSKIVH